MSTMRGGGPAPGGGTSNRVLVAGVGNVFLGDDGFGVQVAHRLAGEPVPEGVQVADFGVRGVHLAYELLDGYDVVVLVDAVPRGDEPGTLYVVEPDLDALAPAAPGAETPVMDAHGMHPEAVLSLCKTLGGGVGRAVVVGCEPADCSERMGLSEPVAAAVGPAADMVRELLDGMAGESRAVAVAADTGAAPVEGDAFERVRAVADAILYEGYLLYPYRKSSAKNRVRWQFGILAPRAWAESAGPVTPVVAGSVESWRQQTECLLEAPHDLRDVTVHVRVRFLQLQVKSVERRRADGGYEPVESLEAGGTVHLSFDEAVPHETDIVIGLAELLGADRALPVAAPEGEEVEQLDDSGRVVRRRWPVSAATTVRAELLDGSVPAYRLRVTTENTESAIGPHTPREEVLRRSLIAAHTLLGGRGLEFHSLIEPAEWAKPHALACRNIHTFPVLAGDGGTRDLVLSSPLLLYDHPRIAPESPGDLHDAAEIDEILSLRTLTLTDEEKREARATDPRAAQILDRVEGMPQEVMARLHGAIRSLRPDRSGEGGV